MKICVDCNQEKPLDEFASRSAKCKPCHNAYNREHYQNNKQYYKDKAKVWRMQFGSLNAYRYSLNAKQFKLLFEKYNGLCWICKVQPATHIDHDHKCCSENKSCGKCVRGMLCNKCNTGIGMLNDSIDTLNNAIEYLGATGGFPAQ